ncbi:NACHT domain-containing protein [Paractinoplanes lichenicola]|uniref:NACHT domain-containing protein n=1 Tax=Paractinoplanes lichenicola TaxID=2802976 RepID=A0ABS1VXV8_9ACTN|nr:NACHT domain-containing protein [Actinoplanes lichenicola]MBL7259304.1 NACHT domain-containing protein [Actinoplanes lichenicola]
MDEIPKIRVVSGNSNEKGDILTRLMGDLFHSLGFVDLQYDLARSGRELDIVGVHEFEEKALRAECKAHTETIGGADVNKFAGVLQAEQNRTAQPVSGYFISLSGFTAPAIEQESEFARRRIALIGPAQLCDRLQKSGFLVSRDRAIDSARRVVSRSLPEGLSVRSVEIVASRLGWAWGIYYGVGPGAPSHACFIHADGHALSAATASPLLAQEGCVIAGSPVASDQVREAASVYRDYLCREFGSITLEGLQADQEIGGRRFRLENLYVPTRLTDTPESTVVDEDPDYSHADVNDHEYQSASTSRGVALGKALSSHARLAILGPPGSGKSTLIKRLAVAYASEPRREEIRDGLPVLRCLPIVVRCRQITGRSAYSIVHMLEEQISRAERPDLRAAFSQAVHEALRDGSLFLLLDGLDEIGDIAEKLQFAAQLRTFMAVYPAVRLVTTSREAGFRPIAGTVAEMCTTYFVHELSDDDIENLSVAWHRVTVGQSSEVEKDARRLAVSICSIDRVRRLASNPLLLTILFLVRRGVGQMPRRRSVLYGKAVEVLLMTWNVEGHSPVDPDEALPQLGFVAYAMMTEGKQSISESELRNLLRKARSEMPDLLMHARLSVSEMIAKIEERSSLLTLAGHDVRDGTLQAIYEFKHLTFQEYLCARAVAEGWLPAKLAELPTIELIKPYLAELSWHEVVVLTAALSGRNASTVMAELISSVSKIPAPSESAAESWNRYSSATLPYIENIAGCLADDVPVTPLLLEKALSLIVHTSEHGNLALDIIGSRYELSLREYVAGAVKSSGYIDQAMSVFVNLNGAKFAGEPVASLLSSCVVLLQGAEEDELLQGLALLVFVCLHRGSALEALVPVPVGYSTRSQLRRPAELAASLLYSGKLGVSGRVLALWAIGWSGQNIRSVRVNNKLQQWLLRSWMERDGDYEEQIPWALMSTPLTGKWGFEALGVEPAVLNSFLNARLESSEREEFRRIRCAVFLCSFYLELPWSREELTEAIKSDVVLSYARQRVEVEFIVRLLKACGESRDNINRINSRTYPRPRLGA